MARIEECILYRDFEHGEILKQITFLIDRYELTGEKEFEEEKDIFYKSVGGLVEMAGMYGFSGNLWHNYLTFLLVNHENAFSTACEIRGAVEGSINQLALHDFRILILTFRYLTGYFILPAAKALRIMRILTATVKCLIKGSGIESVI